MTKLDIYARTKNYTAREVFEAFRKRTVYDKLAGSLPDNGMIWLNTIDIARFVDAVEYDRSQFSKYWVLRLMEPAIQSLEDQGFITSRGMRYAIHEVTLMFLFSQPANVVDSYLKNHLKEPECKR